MVKVTANGKTFTFPAGTSSEQIGEAIDNYFSRQQAEAPQLTSATPDIPASNDDRSLLRRAYDSATGAKEVGAMLASGTIAEPIAGLAGIAAMPLVGADAGSVVNKVRDFLTIEPKTEEGKRIALEIAETLAPLTDRLAAVEQGMGDAAYEKTGSPAAGAAASAVPTAILEALGVGLGKGSIRSVDNMRDIARAKPTPEAQQILDAGERLNVPVMNTDVNPPTTFLGKSTQALSEKLGPLGSGTARASQQAARQEVVEQLAKDFNVELTSPFAEQIVRSLNTEHARRMTQAAEIRNEAVTALSRHGSVPTSNTLAAINSQIARQKRLGAKGDASLIQNLENTRDALEGGDFALVKDIRTEVIDDITALRNAHDRPGAAREAASLQAVKSAMDRDMLEFARTTDRKAAAQWIRSNREFADAYTTAKQTELKRILNKGEATPEMVLPILRGGKPSELRRLKASLTDDGVKAAQAAIIQDVLDESGFFRGDVNPNRVATSLGKTSRQRSVDVFFNSREKVELEGLRRLLEATRRAQDAAAAPPTGVQSIPYLVGGTVGVSGATLGVVPTLVGAGTLSGIAKAYESVPFRNLMLKLGNTRPGSKRETLVLQSVVPGVLAELQAAKAQQEQTPQQLGR